ncbi:MAG: ABC transporter permease subunit, partial [Pararhodobacter sp.]|nr:ABC transporter permease subunit [Pararhodobacter sp.]
HIFPNIIGPIIVFGTLGIASAIREEASLSFLGLGIQPPDASWGNIIRDGITYVLQAPHLAIAPGLILTLSVLAFNMLGDTVRDMFDPRDLASTATKSPKK